MADSTDTIRTSSNDAIGSTIVAISSAIGPAARMIVRASGADACKLAEALCDQLPPPGAASQVKLRWRDVQTPAWVYRFASPRSYTTENLIEFHLPGNPLLARMLLDQLISLGARLAEAGEFTSRAYFAGRIDLSEAEGIAAIIASQNEQELRAARQLLGGELSRRLDPIVSLLAESLALIEAGIDFSEEDISFLTRDELAGRIERVDASLADLLERSARFDQMSHEPVFVLAGRPNAGKSTLLNALAGEQRAIVSPMAGTTRDALSADVRLRRGIIRLIDVAGLDESLTTSASAGIDRQMSERARRMIESADYVIAVRDVLDSSPPVPLCRPADMIVKTKRDLRQTAACEGEVLVSALSGEGMDALRERLDALAFGSAASSASFALNARHRQAIDEAREALKRGAENLFGGAEIVAMELREALDALGRVGGQITPDDVLGRVFAAFCIGK